MYDLMLELENNRLKRSRGYRFGKYVLQPIIVFLMGAAFAMLIEALFIGDAYVFETGVSLRMACGILLVVPLVIYRIREVLVSWIGKALARNRYG